MVVAIAPRTREKGAIMFRKIIWATDGSELSTLALPFAKSVAQQNGAELVALHIDQLLTGGGGGYPLLADEQDLRVRIRAQVAELRADGVNARFELCGGVNSGVADEIAEIAEAEEADLIIIGTHGRGFVRTVLLGSVAKKLVHEVSCPLLVVPVTRLAAGSRRPVAATAGAS
jgi:nucleotide-binding universal stress UspA family protein